MAGAGMPNQRTLPQMGVANNQLQPGGIGQPLGLGQAQPQPAPQPPPGLNKPGYQPFADPAPASLYSDPNLGVSGNRVNLGQATAVNQQKAGQNPASLYSDPNLGGGRGIPPRGDGGGMVNGFDQAPNFGLGTGEYSGNTGVTGGMQKYGGSYTDHSMDGRLSEKFFSGSAEEMRGRGFGDGAGMQPPGNPDWRGPQPGQPSAGAKGGAQVQPPGGAITPPPPQPPSTIPTPPPSTPPVATAPVAPVDQGPRAPNINQSAAAGIQGSMAGAAREMNYQPTNIGGASYNPYSTGSQGYGATTAGAQGFGASGVNAQGYGAAGTGSQGYGAAGTGSQGYGATGAGSQGYGASQMFGAPTVGAQNVTAGQLAGTDLSQYQNPYETQVVQSTLSDLDRSRQMAMGQAGAQATAAGAFGGSRLALMEAETNRSFADQAARSAGQLRQAGFNQAQGMAQQDIAGRMQAGLANQGANLQAGTTTANLMQQAGLSNQSALNQASQFGSSAANQAALVNASAQNQASQFGAQSGNVASLSNQAAQNQASQFGAQAGNVASLSNQAAQNQASQFGAQAFNQAAQQASAQQQAASQFGAQAGNNAALANAASMNQANQFGAQAGNTAQLANQSAFNQAGQFNAQQALAAQMANQQAGLSGSAQRLGAAGQLGNLSNLGFGMGQTVNQNIMQQGMMQQAIQQQLIDAAKAQFAGYTQAPYQSIGLLSQALGASPIPQSQTTSKQPGMFDYLTMGAQLYGASDSRLKENITQIGSLPNGLGLYTWDWTDDANEKGLSNPMTTGVIAQEVQAVMPELVKMQPSGYLAVNYGELVKGIYNA